MDRGEVGLAICTTVLHQATCIVMRSKWILQCVQMGKHTIYTHTWRERVKVKSWRTKYYIYIYIENKNERGSKLK